MGRQQRQFNLRHQLEERYTTYDVKQISNYWYMNMVFILDHHVESITINELRRIIKVVL